MRSVYINRTNSKMTEKQMRNLVIAKLTILGTIVLMPLILPLLAYVWSLL
jgi:hypothetical protein